MGKLSEEFLGGTEPSMKASPPIKVVQTSPWSSGVSKKPSREDAVRWRDASEAYKKTNYQMPIQYTKDYHFFIYGVKK